MTLSEKDVRDIATYTRIGLTDEEVATMTRDLNDIIANLEPITQYDLEGVEPTFHPIAGLVNVMREDVPQPGFTQEEALANSESTEDGAFRIPTILGGGDN
ncbi:MAG: Asp-tRNA(Asn)/Glu-tRNA(Gln) amidotransferase subunit GatC [Coriobacteriales bacterium]|nr:Asp-tRNA(Asn)/Glu-tRNA(Gln) amidotransferase subunit GatC [Coriobacteriales bacterium]